VLKLIDITEDKQPNLGDLIIDPSDNALGVVYDINKQERFKEYSVYWPYCLDGLNNSLDTQENPISVLRFKLIHT
jgi:hypothetical protein